MMNARLKTTHPGGFALVVTISLMLLLVVLATGLLSLSALALRSGSQSAAQAEARANARLALLMAIGELQRELGPDRRISARAEILDRNPATVEADEVANPHYLGVWESWDTWLTDEKDSLSIQDTYKSGRDSSLFRSWLVSHPDAENFETALEQSSGDDTLVICGEGSAGPEPSNHVRAGRVPVRSGSSTTGAYAWWVSDEAQKVRLDLQPREDTETIEGTRVVSSHTGRMGIETMSEMSDYDTAPESLEKMVTTGLARLSAAEADERFHDLTAHSLGLLTDVRSGGFKGDLNLAFESSEVPAEMDEAELFGGRPFDAPIRPMTGEVGDIEPQNPYVAPMSWRQLREYYRLYREFPGSGIMRPITWESGEPVTRRFLMGNSSTVGKWDTAGYTRLPIMLRQTWIIATKTEPNPASTGGRDYYVLAVPIVSLWNPFNVTLKVDSEEISYMGSMFYSVPLRQKTYRGSQLLGETRFPDEDEAGWGGGKPNRNISAAQLGYRMIPTERRGLIEFEPGEVRVFSTDDEILHGVRLLDDPAAMKGRHFFATPGYTPVQDSGTGVLRGLKCRVNPGSGSSTGGPLRISLRLEDRTPSGRHYDPFWIAASPKSAMAFSFHEWRSASQGVYFEDGTLVGQHEWHDVVRLNMFSLDWLTSREMEGAWIVQDGPAYRAGWPAVGSPPLPIGILSVVAKSPEQLDYVASGGFADDFRNRGWLHAPPTRMGCYLMNPSDLNRADCAYQLHFTEVNGDQEVSQYLEAEGRNGFFGGGYSRARGQTHVSALDLPVAPIGNMGSLASVRMDPARPRIDQRNDSSAPSADLPDRGYHNMKHMAHPGAAFGAGIGNAYAHPMIETEEVYTRNDFGQDPGWGGRLTTNMAVCDDYWDHLFLANEELWDSWFFSGIAPVVSRGQVVTPTAKVAEEFFSGEATHLSPHFEPDLRGNTPEELAGLAEIASATPGENGWDRIAAHILNRGQFNVNSTSVEAWKAVLMSLADRPIACNDIDIGPSVIAPDPDHVSLSRHPHSNSKSTGDDPVNEHAWRGVRTLDEQQIEKLAEEIVRQVKLRGPFLNMTEFINRRLSGDELGVTGALQAAIDWDEFNAGYNGSTSGTGESINGAFKRGDAMIDQVDLPASYPNPKAATGSRYAGIPGYVMQSDLLQGISASLSVRGDTFLVRACGESITAEGKVAARAWCEAVVQRTPEYVHPADEADKKMRTAGESPDVVADLHPLNREFGRRFEVVSFRWLSRDEI